MKNFMILVHYESKSAGWKKLSKYVVRYEQNAPNEQVILLPFLNREKALWSDYEVNGPREDICHNKNYTQDKCVLAIVLVEHNDSLYVEQQWTHKQQRDDDLENCNKEEDILESLVIICWQGDSIHEVDDDDEYDWGHYEDFDLPL